MIYLHTLKTIDGLEIKERYGLEFRRIRRLQPRDPISCRFAVYRGDIQLEEFRRLKSAAQFCIQSHWEPKAEAKT